MAGVVPSGECGHKRRFSQVRSNIPGDMFHTFRLSPNPFYAVGAWLERDRPDHRSPEDEMISVNEVESVTAELVAAFERLIPQLSSSSPPPTSGVLAEIVNSPSTLLLVAQDSEKSGADAIVGSMTLVLFRIPTGMRAWIEDVVVDEGARGKGVGDALNRHALQLAHERGARSVDLTSRPSREAANRLYQRLGFEKRATNVYRHAGPK